MVVVQKRLDADVRNIVVLCDDRMQEFWSSESMFDLFLRAEMAKNDNSRGIGSDKQ